MKSKRRFIACRRPYRSNMINKMVPNNVVVRCRLKPRRRPTFSGKLTDVVEICCRRSTTSPVRGDVGDGSATWRRLSNRFILLIASFVFTRRSCFTCTASLPRSHNDGCSDCRVRNAARAKLQASSTSQSLPRSYRQWLIFNLIIGLLVYWRLSNVAACDTSHLLNQSSRTGLRPCV